jgi:hypothetical protein
VQAEQVDTIFTNLIRKEKLDLTQYFLQLHLLAEVPAVELTEKTAAPVDQVAVAALSQELVDQQVHQVKDLQAVLVTQLPVVEEEEVQVLQALVDLQVETAVQVEQQVSLAHQ